MFLYCSLIFQCFFTRGGGEVDWGGTPLAQHFSQLSDYGNNNVVYHSRHAPQPYQQTHTHINNVSKEGERFALSLLSVYIITLIHSRSLVTVHTADGFVHLFSSLINSHYAQKYLHTDTLTVTFSHALLCFDNQTSTTSLKSENL